MSQTVAVKEGQGRGQRAVLLRIPDDAELVRAAVELRSLGADKHPAAGRYGLCIGLYLPCRTYTVQDVDLFTGARGPITPGGVIGSSCAFWCGEHRIADTMYEKSPPSIHYYATPVQHEQMDLFRKPIELREEGAPITLAQTQFERDPRLRDMCLNARGIACLICGFNSSQCYGPKMTGVIEVHHLEPLSEVGEVHLVDPTRDLLPVCPNCHTVIHRRSPPFTPDEVRLMLIPPSD